MNGSSAAQQRPLASLSRRRIRAAAIDISGDESKLMSYRRHSGIGGGGSSNGMNRTDGSNEPDVAVVVALEAAQCLKAIVLGSIKISGSSSCSRSNKRLSAMSRSNAVKAAAKASGTMRPIAVNLLHGASAAINRLWFNQYRAAKDISKARGEM